MAYWKIDRVESILCSRVEKSLFGTGHAGRIRPSGGPVLARAPYL